MEKWNSRQRLSVQWYIVPAVIALLSLLLAAGIGYGWQRLRDSGEPDTHTRVLFDDEFNGTRLDARNWVTCYNNFSVQYQGCSNYGNYESEWYRVSQVSVTNGSLQLIADKQTVSASSGHGYIQNYPYVSGMVSGGNLSKTVPVKWMHTYGYYEARMLVPSGQAVWPAFWLVPADASWPPEIDGMELLGDKPSQILTTYFWPGPNNTAAKDSSIYTAASNLSNAWHTYAVDWQPGSLTWYLDGKLIRSVHSTHVPTKPMYMILNLAIGGLLPGYPDKTTPDTVELLVDYVRVYQTKPASGR